MQYVHLTSLSFWVESLSPGLCCSCDGCGFLLQPAVFVCILFCVECSRLLFCMVYCSVCLMCTLMQTNYLSGTNDAESELNWTQLEWMNKWMSVKYRPLYLGILKNNSWVNISFCSFVAHCGIEVSLNMKSGTSCTVLLSLAMTGDWNDVWTTSKMLELLREVLWKPAVYLNQALQNLENGTASEVWNWWTNAVDFNVWLYKLGVKRIAANVLFLTDFIVIVNQDKCDPTSCSTFLSGRVWKLSTATKYTSFSALQFSVTIILLPY